MKRNRKKLLKRKWKLKWKRQWEWNANKRGSEREKESGSEIGNGRKCASTSQIGSRSGSIIRSGRGNVNVNAKAGKKMEVVV